MARLSLLPRVGASLADPTVVGGSWGYTVGSHGKDRRINKNYTVEHCIASTREQCLRKHGYLSEAV